VKCKNPANQRTIRATAIIASMWLSPCPETSYIRDVGLCHCEHFLIVIYIQSSHVQVKVSFQLRQIVFFHSTPFTVSNLLDGELTGKRRTSSYLAPQVRNPGVPRKNPQRRSTMPTAGPSSVSVPGSLLQAPPPRANKLQRPRRPRRGIISSDQGWHQGNSWRVGEAKKVSLAWVVRDAERYVADRGREGAI
jgi:hypothetical protein